MNTVYEIICTECGNACLVKVTLDERNRFLNIDGNGCPYGITCARREVMRIITGSTK